MRLYIVRTIVKTIYCCFSTLGFIVMGISTFKGDARYVDAVKKIFTDNSYRSLICIDIPTFKMHFNTTLMLLFFTF